MDMDGCPDAAQLSVWAVLGNAGDGGWPSRLREAVIDVLALDAAEAHRTRLRKRTAGGTDVAIALERGVQLRDGDVLDWDESKQTAVVVRVDLPDVMIVDLSTLLGGPAEALLARSVEIGHALGNQHWPALVKGGRVYVPVTVAPRVMATVLKTHDVDSVSCSFARGADVQPQLAPEEARMLFAGPAGHTHRSAAGSGEEPT